MANQDSESTIRQSLGTASINQILLKQMRDNRILLIVTLVVCVLGGLSAPSPVGFVFVVLFWYARRILKAQLVALRNYWDFNQTLESVDVITTIHRFPIWRNRNHDQYLLVEHSGLLSKDDIEKISELLEQRPFFVGVEYRGRQMTLGTWLGEVRPDRLPKTTNVKRPVAVQPQLPFKPRSLEESLEGVLDDLETIIVTSYRATSVACETRSGIGSASEQDLAVLNRLLKTGELKYFELDGKQHELEPPSQGGTGLPGFNARVYDGQRYLMTGGGVAHAGRRQCL